MGMGGGGGKWTIFTLSTCPHCREAKNLLREKGIQYREIVCDDLKKKEMVNKKFNGYRTYPKVVNDKGKFIGGREELEKYLK